MSLEYYECLIFPFNNGSDCCVSFFFLREWIRKDEAIDSVPKKETVLKTISGCVNRSVREMAAIETVPKHPLAFLKLQACLRDHRDKSYKRMRPVKNGPSLGS